ncbi:hypothetical protein ACFFLZ_01410 [Photobacterium aphoticum]|uniref:Uncharacterized protein n=1 Tax=Photobacterium aphoticum TaxID=754436 RepID=A0A0J1GJP0_9GAMM|nr:hypothetical protein [Photobacterium aphoticum]KLU99899.1 hypothetical protein ABT58_15695 [Photobacterium aphoticum]PSU56843.1 hypothetical protein C9I90_11595 [Photobacterium aphoticum]GHA40913.1 hypothetical protein GCM10007086_13200 [Photobacterium aphoticum]
MGLKCTWQQNVLPMLRLPLACLFAKGDDVTFIRPAFQHDQPCGANKHLHLLSQAKREIVALKMAIKQAGFQLSEIVRAEVILSQDVDEYQLGELCELLESLPGEVEVHYEENGLLARDIPLASTQLIAIEAMLTH